MNITRQSMVSSKTQQTQLDYILYKNIPTIFVNKKMQLMSTKSCIAITTQYSQ